MYKIKLLILFLVSFILVSCTKNNYSQTKFTVVSSGDDLDYNISNTLIQYLDSMNMYDSTNYDFKIDFSSNFKQDTFITNIDKTTDRSKISFNIEYRVTKKFRDFTCPVFIQKYKKVSSYIYASGEYNRSNEAAEREIKNNLIDLTTNDFIDDLLDNKRMDCFYRIEPKR